MKTLVLAVLLAVAQAPSPVPRQASEKGTQGRQNVENKKKGNDATTGKPVLVGKENLGRPSKPNGNEPAHIDPAPSNIRISDIPPVTVNPGKWEMAYLWFSGGLVLAGSLQVWLLFGTLRTVRRHGNTMISSERAWMIAKITQPTFDEVMNPQNNPVGWCLPIQFQIINLGKTPAVVINHFITSSSEPTVNRGAVPLVLNLPNVPLYTTITKSKRKTAVGTLYEIGRASCRQLIFGTASGVLGFVGSPRISRRTLRFDFCRANSELPVA